MPVGICYTSRSKAASAAWCSACEARTPAHKISRFESRCCESVFLHTINFLGSESYAISVLFSPWPSAMGGRSGPCAVWSPNHGHWARAHAPLGSIRQTVQAFTTFQAPKFSPDGRYGYFLAEFAAPSHALWRLDLSMGNALFLTDAIDFGGISKGVHRGQILARLGPQARLQNTVTQLPSTCSRRTDKRKPVLQTKEQI